MGKISKDKRDVYYRKATRSTLLLLYTKTPRLGSLRRPFESVESSISTLSEVCSVATTSYFWLFYVICGSSRCRTCCRRRKSGTVQDLRTSSCRSRCYYAGLHVLRPKADPSGILIVDSCVDFDIRCVSSDKKICSEFLRLILARARFSRTVSQR